MHRHAHLLYSLLTNVYGRDRSLSFFRMHCPTGEAAERFEQMPVAEVTARLMSLLRRMFEPRGTQVPDPLQVRACLDSLGQLLLRVEGLQPLHYHSCMSWIVRTAHAQ